MRDFNQRTNVPSYHRTTLISGLYAIADSGFVAIERLPAFVRCVLEGGCRVVQLRMKAGNASTASNASNEQHFGNAGYDEMKRVAADIMRLKSEFDFTFIINDHADLALELGADGVHVGENDEPVKSIRARAGDRLLIGYSSHSMEEAMRAEQEGADYVAFGAIFPTKTKGPGHPVQGLTRLSEVTGALRVPVVAIGGIGRKNLDDVIKADAGAVAMISALALADDVTAEARWFVEAIG